MKHNVIFEKCCLLCLKKKNKNHTPTPGKKRKKRRNSFKKNLVSLIKWQCKLILKAWKNVFLLLPLYNLIDDLYTSMSIENSLNYLNSYKSFWTFAAALSDSFYYFCTPVLKMPFGASQRAFSQAQNRPQQHAPKN